MISKSTLNSTWESQKHYILLDFNCMNMSQKHYIFLDFNCINVTLWQCLATSFQDNSQNTLENMLNENNNNNNNKHLRMYSMTMIYPMQNPIQPNRHKSAIIQNSRKEASDHIRPHIRYLGVRWSIYFLVLFL